MPIFNVSSGQTTTSIGAATQTQLTAHINACRTYIANPTHSGDNSKTFFQEKFQNLLTLQTRSDSSTKSACKSLATSILNDAKRVISPQVRIAYFSALQELHQDTGIRSPRGLSLDSISILSPAQLSDITTQINIANAEVVQQNRQPINTSETQHPIATGITSIQPPASDLETTLTDYLDTSPENERNDRQRVVDTIRKLSSLTPQGTVNLQNCSSLTALPTGFNPQGHVILNNCRSLTTIPESMFTMPPTTTVDLENTGLNATTVAEINRRQNEPGYNGPRFQLSVRDTFRPETNAIATQLPSLLAAIGHPQDHPLWTVATTQTQMNSPWNDLSRFLTRLLNETPRQNGQIPTELTQNLTRIVSRMEEEFSQNETVPTNGFITTILRDAHRGIGTCIDKVKVGYVLMQLHASQASASTHEQRALYTSRIATIEKIIDFVSDINLNRVVYDTLSNQFSQVSCADYQDNDTTYHFTIPGTDFSNNQLGLTLPPGTATQLFIQDVNIQNNNRFQPIRIGDEVEDMHEFLTKCHQIGHDIETHHAKVFEK